ncbi:MAG: acetyltransferase [Thermodesulfobacteriota bacterium]|nr:acetyltransferase [Thermodesulfobacteriota bacterium]
MLKSGLQNIAVYGAGGFGLEVAMLIEQINMVSLEWHIIGFFDDGVRKGKIVNGYPVLGGIQQLNQWDSALSMVVAVGTPMTKRRIVDSIDNQNVSYPILVHPTVITGDRQYVTVGEGSIICAGTIITTNVLIGKHVILNLACTVGHETEIGDFSSLMPACNISGEVKIGQATFWGTGAIVINRRIIGNNCVLGAGAVVTKDIPDNVTAVGVPAKVVRQNT